MTPSTPPNAGTVPGLMTPAQVDEVDTALSTATAAATAASNAQSTADGAATAATNAAIAASNAQTTANNAATTASNAQTAIEQLGAKAATIATEQSQASGATYGDLATVGPRVTVTVPAGGKSYAVVFKADVWRNFAGFSATISFSISGATTVAAGAHVSVVTPAGAQFRQAGVVVGVVALNAGDNVITAKYSNNGGPDVWNFLNRGLLVVPLG